MHRVQNARQSADPVRMENDMQLSDRIEAAMAAAVRLGQGGQDAPPKLAQALDYSVTPGGARIRPTIFSLRSGLFSGSIFSSCLRY